MQRSGRVKTDGARRQYASLGTTPIRVTWHDAKTRLGAARQGKARRRRRHSPAAAASSWFLSLPLASQNCSTRESHTLTHTNSERERERAVHSLSLPPHTQCECASRPHQSPTPSPSAPHNNKNHHHHHLLLLLLLLLLCPTRIHHPPSPTIATNHARCCSRRLLAHAHRAFRWSRGASASCGHGVP
jgi:hypothetical protein